MGMRGFVVSLSALLLVAGCSHSGGQSGTDQSDLGRGREHEAPIVEAGVVVPSSDAALADASAISSEASDAEADSAVETEAGEPSEPSGEGFDCPEAQGLDPSPDVADPTTANLADITDAIALSVTAFPLPENHACVVHASGRVSCWGEGSYGQLGDVRAEDSATPVEVLGLTDAIAVAVTYGASCALRSNGTVACWGDNGEFALGNGDEDIGFASTPVPVCGVTGAARLEAGSSNTCAIVRDGTLECWGWTEGYELNAVHATPTPAVGLTGLRDVSLGGGTCILRGSRDVECWGMTSIVGFLTEDPDDRLTVLSGGEVIDIGGYGSCALYDNGDVVCWADSTGYGVQKQVSVDLSNVIALADHGDCAILETGEVACWDCVVDDEAFTLGCTEPQRVPELSDAIAVSGNCALRANGRVACWQSIDGDLVPIREGSTEPSADAGP